MSSAKAVAASKPVDCTAAEARVLLIGKDPQLGQSLENGLVARKCQFDYAAGSADALRRLRQACYSVVITDPKTSIEEDLSLLAEMRSVRPGVRVIVLAPSSTPENIIAALRARVFLCKTAPFDPLDIADYAVRAAATSDSLVGIEVLSAQPDWLSLRINSQILTAERVVEFLTELQTRLPETPRAELMMAFREILMNAVEHGAGFGRERWLRFMPSTPRGRSFSTFTIRERDSTGICSSTPPFPVPRTSRVTSSSATRWACVPEVSAS